MFISKLRPHAHVFSLSLAALLIPAITDAADGSLSCMRIKESAPRGAGATVASDDLAKGCTIKGGAALACTPASASIAADDATDGDETLVFDRLCYEVTCASEDKAEESAADDRLGAHVFRKAESSLVCTPATITVLGSVDGARDTAGRRGVIDGGPGNHVDATTCGNFNGDASLSASDALGILRTAIGSSKCIICICDVDNTATITATDALKLLKFAVGQPSTLTCQPDGNPISWDGGGDGYTWTNADNWSLPRIPNECDNVTIVTVATVTHASGTNGAKSINADSDLDITGGTLRLRGTVDVSGLFRLRGGSLTNADVLAPGTGAPLVLTNSGGTLDGASIATDLQITDTSSYAYVQNSLVLDGTAEVGNGAGLFFQGTGEQRLDGSGSVHFQGPGAQVYSYNAIDLHIGADMLIHGTNGSVGSNQTDSHLTNEGTIDCDAAGTITVGSFGDWTNQGTLGAHNGGTLTLTGPWTNTGTIELDTTSTLNFGGVFDSIDVGTINRLGGTINLTGQMNNAGVTFTLDSAKGDWRLFGGTIVGGTIASAEGAKLVYTTSGGNLDGVTSDADMDLTTTSTYSYVNNGLTLNGTATFGSSAGLFFQGTGQQELAGTGDILFTGPGANLYNYSNTLHIGSDMLVHGSNGNVGGNQTQSAMINDGTIDCDTSGTMTVGTVAPWTNNGTIGAHNGCTVTVQGPWTNAGTLALDNTSTINLAGTFTLPDIGTISRTGGTINITGQLTNPGTLTLNAETGDFRLFGGKIVGGTLAAADGAKLAFTTSGGTLDGVTSASDLDLTGTSTYSYVDHGLTLNGTATFGSSAGLFFQGTGQQELAGTGDILFTGPGANLYNYSNTLHIGSDILVHGSNGNVGGNQTQSAMINDGTIDCDTSGTMSVGTVAAWTNNGTIGAHNGCTVTLGGPWTNSGTFELDGTSTLVFSGAFDSADIGTIDRNGGTINLTGQMTTSGTFTTNAGTGDIRLFGGKIIGGTLAEADGAKLVFTSSGGTLTGVTSTSDLDLTTSSSSYAYIENGLTLNGTATFGNSSGLYFQGTGEQQLAGTGTIQMNGPGANLYNYSNTLRIGSGILVHGANGNVGGNQTQSALINDGTIDCDTAGTLTVGTVASWTNNGTMRASVAGSVITAGGPWTNDGAIELVGGGTLNSSAGFTQSGSGELQVGLKGTGSSDLGKVAVNGAATLGGTLTIVLENGFVPSIGNTFQIMTYASATGSFSTINGINIGGGKKFDVNIGATGITLEVVSA